MKKAISYLLYILFFGFSAVIITSCIILIINTANNKKYDYDQIEAVVINGGEETENSEYEQIEEISFKGSKYYKSISSTYGYDSLKTDEEQYLYEKIKKNIYYITNSTDQNGHYRTERLKITGVRMSEYSIRKVVNAFSFDNPQVFWLENLFGYAYTGNDTIVEFYSVFSADECEKYINTFNKKINETVLSVGDNMSEYEREKYIHDKLLENCTYKKGVTGSGDGWQYFSAYGAIVEGEAVCEGYAKSMQILLSQLGIECYIIRGEGEGVGHMWNVVKLGGEWYHLDPTWNDTDDIINYEYFNVNTEMITKNHIINEDDDNIDFENMSEDTTVKYNFFVPMCTSLAMNYYNVEGYLIDEFDEQTDNDMISVLVNAANKNQMYVPLRFGNSMTYNEYIDKLFYSSPYKFYYYLQQANEQLDSTHKIDKDNISVLKNETALTIRIKINIINNE